MSIYQRRLQVALDKVTMMPERRDWSTPEGQAFLREVMAAEHEGHSLDDLGRDLGIPNLRYVMSVWRKDLFR